MTVKDDRYLDINIDTGADFSLTFTLYRTGSTPVDLTDAIVNAELRDYPEGKTSTMFTAIHNGEGGAITFRMPHETSAALGFPYGTYNVVVTFPDGAVEDVLHGKAFISENVTRLINKGDIYHVIAFDSFDDFPAEGNLYRIYLDRENSSLYFWNGTQYISLLNALKGDAATIEIGDVITGDPGTPVIVENSGDLHHAVFNFTIPRGEQGVIYPTGDWDPTKAYTKLDMVYYDGSSYVAKENVPVGIPITDTNYWQITASKGDRGTSGYSEIVTSSFDETAYYEAGDVVIYQNKVYRLLQPYYGEGGWETVVARKLATMDHKANSDVIARTFDTTTYYYAGDYVFRDGILYRFNVAHTAGAWDSTQVEVATVSNALLDLGDDLMKVRNIIAEPFSETTSYTSGDYVVRDGYLYRFTEDHEAGVWDSTQVELIIISDKLQRLDSTKALAYMDSIDYESNYITNKPRTKPAPITTTTDDTPANWLTVGNGYFYYDTAGQLNGQPTTSGILSNVVISGTNFTDVIQIWSNIPTGKIYARGGDANGWSSDGWVEYLPITGGTLTGAVYRKSDTIDMRDPTAPEYTQLASAYLITDKNNEQLGSVEAYRNTADDSALRLSAKRIVNGSTYVNNIDLKIAEDGTRTYTISDPAAFRVALNLGAVATQSIIPIANGGTGAETANEALANLGAVNKAGDTMTGPLTLANEGLRTPSTDGFKTNGSGNFIHTSTNASNYWGICKNDGTAVFTVNFETGVVMALDSNGTLRNLAPMYYGTSALTPGISELATGLIYLQYE